MAIPSFPQTLLSLQVISKVWLVTNFISRYSILVSDANLALLHGILQAHIPSRHSLHATHSCLLWFYLWSLKWHLSLGKQLVNGSLPTHISSRIFFIFTLPSRIFLFLPYPNFHFVAVTSLSFPTTFATSLHHHDSLLSLKFIFIFSSIPFFD